MYATEYVAPTLTVDGVVFQLIGTKLAVLLIQRTQEPFRDWWALPGGYNPVGETTTEALSRILLAKAGVDTRQLPLVEQLYTFDTVARDPRGHAVSVTYMALGRGIVPVLSDTTQYPQFFPLDALPRVAYDHKEIIQYAHERLQAKINQTTAVFALLPGEFTLSQLQAAYEAILGRSLDKRNFRKKFLSFELLKATTKMDQEGAHRPARLYVFQEAGLQPLSRSFD